VSKQEISVGMLGMGTVGRGVYRILKQNQAEIKQKVGASVKIKKILVRDPNKNRGIELQDGILTTIPEEVVDNPEFDIIVEVMGGTNRALEYSLRALKKGKSLVTANKDMLAEYGKDIFDAAAAGKGDVFFEGSVAGGIPIIKPLKDCLAANRISEVIGIINGTTNYMLTRMSREKIDFNDVLAEAKTLGYAEADPTSDIEGFDAARKLAILASIAFNSRVDLNQVYVEGITRIAAEDIIYASELNYVIKLLAIAKESDDGIELRVHPALLPKSHPLAAVHDVFNAVFITGDAVGEVMFFGRGAGELPTASAVTADVMNAARNRLNNISGTVSCTCYSRKKVKPMGETKTKYYIRIDVADKPGVLAGIASIFGNNDVSLASVIQKNTTGKAAQIVLVTHEVFEKNLQDALKIIKALSTVNEISNVVRVEGD